MKVLFLTNLPSPYRDSFFSEFGKMCELTVLYERESASDRDNKWKAKNSTNYKPIYLKGKKIGTDNSLCVEVIKYLKKNEKIIVGMYSTYTAMIAIMYMRLKKISFYISTDGGFVKDENIFKYSYKRFLIGSASAWFATGNFAKDYLVYYGAKEDKIHTYPFTSLANKDILKECLTIEEKREIRRKLNMSEKRIILYVGQFIYRKGIDILLQACCNMSCNDIGIYLIGGESEEYSLFCENKGLKNVHQISFLTKEELDKYYLAADIFVLPTREDVWGLVVNEAMAKGLPIIVSDWCGAGKELVDDRNGVVFKSKDICGLKNAIERIINDENMMINMSINSLEKIRPYTFYEMAKKHYQVLNKDNSVN